MKNKKFVNDLVAMACMIVAIATGLILHNHVHHIHYYDSVMLWGTHEAIGLIIAAAIAIHCIQHSFWFKNYTKIPRTRKMVTTILLGLAIIEIITGLTLWNGSHSKAVSITHYITGIAFTIIATGHVAKRWHMFRTLRK